MVYNLGKRYYIFLTAYSGVLITLYLEGCNQLHIMRNIYK